MSVSHVVAGAALGSLVGPVPGYNVAAFAVGWGSHYVLDSLPHWERLFGSKGSDFNTDTKASDWPRHIYYQAIVDGLVAIALLALILAWRSELTSFWASPVFWGALGGCLPDLLDNVPYWNRRLAKYSLIKKQRDFHQSIHITDTLQKRSPKYLGLLTQIIVIGLGIWVLY